MHDVIDNLFQRDEASRAFLKRLRNAAGQFAPIERLMGAIPFHHTQIRTLDFFVGGEAIAAAKAFAAAADTGTIPGLARIDDLVITRPALGATHSVTTVTTTLRIVASMHVYPSAQAACRAAAFFGFFSANSKPTFPFSSFRCAENGRPFFETNLGSRSVLLIVISFWTCSLGISRWRIILLTRKVHVFGEASAFSQT